MWGRVRRRHERAEPVSRAPIVIRTEPPDVLAALIIERPGSETAECSGVVPGAVELKKLDFPAVEKPPLAHGNIRRREEHLADDEDAHDARKVGCQAGGITLGLDHEVGQPDEGATERETHKEPFDAIEDGKTRHFRPFRSEGE